LVFVLSERPPSADLATIGQQAPINAKDWMSRGVHEVVLVFQGCFVIFFELILITAIATTLSLFFSPTVNFSITAFIFVAGSLQDVLAAWTRRNEFPITKLLATGLYFITPHFQDFNIVGNIVHPEVKVPMSAML